MMRIVIDLQAAQSGSSRFRGIGRYSLSLTQWLARNRGHHEVFVALNGEFAESNEPLRAALMDLIPPENIFVWEAPGPNFGADTGNANRRKAAELIRESALATLDPDYVVISSVFEGWGDNVVTSVGQLSSSVPTAVILYDLIPLIHRNIYLQDKTLASWYENKLSHLRSSDLLLAISESSRQESIEYLGIDPRNTVNISTAADEHFTPGDVGLKIKTHLADTYGIKRPFVMYTGGIDFRKNIEGLIKAYASIAQSVRRRHQLAIVCAVQEPERVRLLAFAANLGLSDGELIMTGFISEDDLVACYRSCKLFVFPSWHEGFGLPVLEAMKCGRAVIASDRSSLPEVVGLDSALFDPFDLDALSSMIGNLLIDDSKRADLERHSLKQAAKFNWDRTSRRAWAALEESHARHQEQRALPVAQPLKRPRLAFLSPLPPEASGIADYSAELLPELARHYHIDVIVVQNAISDVSITANYAVRDVAWFRENAHKYDRILYHFGNSQFHMHMFDLLRSYPGVVVLHDFYLSGILYYREAVGVDATGFARELLNAHGWPAVVKRFQSQDVADAIWAYPCNLQVIQDALGVIVHADYSLTLARQWYGADAAESWRLIPLLRQPLLGLDKARARETLGVGPNDFVVCSFGMLAKTKMNDRLLSAWLASPLAKDPKCHLVFVGQNDGGDYGADMQQAITKADTDRIRMTGWTDTSIFRQWLAAADIGVQLRTLSRGETSAAVLDCMNAGLATIVNANGSMGELPIDCVWLMDDVFSNEDLVEALDVLWNNHTRREALSKAALAHIRQRHQPRRCGAEYAAAIEHFYAKGMTLETGLARTLVESDLYLDAAEWGAVGRSMARSFPRRPRLKRLLVDVSILVQHDARSGIQRVVRSILSHWLSKPPTGWVVEPIYAELDKPGFRYARRFTSRYLNIWDGWCEDEVVEPVPGDIFVGLDLNPTPIIHQQHGLLRAWRRCGVNVQFIIYDLLPIMAENFFMPDARPIYQAWLGAVTQFDGVTCISRAVADTCHDWLDHFGAKRDVPLAINWFHLGGDTENSIPTTGLPENADAIISTLRGTPSFLMVGTIEPRKGARQVLAALEALWSQDVTVNLVLVGKLGWMMDDFADYVRSHPQLDSKLFWLEAISDEFLDHVYASCSCLLAASEGEGFGLPLIEAARHGLPVLARDIPVFREVAGDAATYFDNSRDPETISRAVTKLLRSTETSIPPVIRWQTWAESAQTLLDITLGLKTPYRQWLPDDALRFWGSDNRLLSSVGISDSKHMRTSNQAGFLIYGPYLPIMAKSYRIRASGAAQSLIGTEYMDVSSHGGTKIYWRDSFKVDRNEWIIDDVITFDGSIKDLEIRVWVDEATDMSVESIVLEPFDDAARDLVDSKVTVDM